MTIPFVGPEARARSVSVSNQSTINLVNAVKGVGSKAPVVLETAPGLIDKGQLGDGPIRTAKMLQSRIRAAATRPELYGVYGSKLMAQGVGFSNTEIGTLNSADGQVRMARGRNYIMLVDGADGYTYDGTTFAQISDLDFTAIGAPTHCVYLDGFFIVNDADNDNFYISALEDPTSWNALDFDAASVAPDNALGIEATESTLWIFGDETAQAYYNNANSDFPYGIILNATQEVGVLAPYSLAESDDGIFYLATTPEGGRFVYQIQGHSGRVVSGDEQEAYLSLVTNPEQAYGFIYKMAGKSFYVLQLPAVGGQDPRTSATLVYNIKAGMWERRELQDGTGWRAGGHGILDGMNIVGSRIQARQLELSLTTYTDAGQEMIRTRRSQIYHNNDYSMDWWAVVIDVQSGVGNASPPGDDPQLKLRYSDDGGQNWSDYLLGSVGKIGETAQRVVFRNLGSSRNRLLEVVFSDPTDMTIIGAYAEVQILND